MELRAEARGADRRPGLLLRILGERWVDHRAVQRMTSRVPAIEDADFISRRIHELRAEHDQAIASEECDCPTSPNVHGIEIKVHVLGCPAIVEAATFHYEAMLNELNSGAVV